MLASLSYGQSQFVNLVAHVMSFIPVRFKYQVKTVCILIQIIRLKGRRART